jgi:hypothetical protein
MAGIGHRRSTKEAPCAPLTGVRAAVFDTRVKLFIHGDAAGRMSRTLEGAGATIVAKPQGFIVQSTEGPLAPGQTGKAGSRAAFIGTALRAHACAASFRRIRRTHHVGAREGALRRYPRKTARAQARAVRIGLSVTR